MNQGSTCPACGTAGGIVLEVIQRDHLNQIYANDFGIDVKATVTEDVSLIDCERCGVKFFWPQFVAQEDFYAKLQSHSWYYIKDKFEFHFAKRFISGGAKVLEIGAGEGHFAAHIPQAKYLGLEYSSGAIELAAKSGVTLLKQSAEEVAEREGASFDVVVAFQVLEHVADVGSFLDAVVRSVLPGGLLIISVPAEDSFMGMEVNNVLNMPPHHQTRWTDDALRRLATRLGLTLIEMAHEQLTDQYIGPFAAALAMKGTQLKLGRADVSIDLRFRGFVLRALCSPLKAGLRMAVKSRSWRPNGHTVCVSFRKPL